MKAIITDIPVGTKFSHNGKEYEVTNRDEYPFIEAKCLTQPNDFEGHNVVFCDFESVEVEDGIKLWKSKIVQAGQGFYVRTERLV